MTSDSRYEILNLIAQGEFATVSRARDRDLGREVAVKQIHAQYLADPRQLARYWQEAQLLASLQHPNILTIYDVVRPRGWLILELMKSSLKPAAEGDPMDLDQLRSVLMQCLGGLAFLHSNNVIHRDVKPSNLLVGAQGRVKLGDFGLARRASNEEGSMLKGTTKYMAPELLSAQFGDVGPASDLYSLGFTAYELMVGRQFESLLPTLSTFGRDKQLAWMTWHAAADVKLPEIERVLEGVPDDLAHVIQRLIAKDRSQRYASAADALHDLQTGQLAAGLPSAAGPEAEAEAALAARKKKRIAALAALCGAITVVVCALIAFKAFNRRPPPKAQANSVTVHGVISDVYPGSHELGVAPADGGEVKDFIIKPQDIIYVNGERHLLQDLECRDQVDVVEYRDADTKKDIREIHATRPGHFATGKLLAKDEAARTIDMSLSEESGDGQIKVFVPSDLPILLNGQPKFAGRAVGLAALLPGDRLKAHYESEDDKTNKASKLEVQREVELKGTLAADYDGQTRLLSIVDESTQRVVKLPFGSQYAITVNGEPVANPSDLRRGDRVAIKHDSYIAQVVARRTLGAEGTIEQVRFEPPQSLSVTEGGERKATYLVGPECKITLAGDSVPFDVLRAGDHVAIEHGEIDTKSTKAIDATSIAADRPVDPARWALLIAVQNYDDTKLPKLDDPLADVEALADVLRKRYRIPMSAGAEQMRVFEDPSSVTLEREVPEFLKRIGKEGHLIVYFVGHAGKDDSGKVYVAPKDFRSDKPEVNGRPLQWLVDLLEECPAEEKLLLLDASHGGADQSAEPSSAEMIQSLKPRANRARLNTVIAVASCDKGQHGLTLPDRSRDLFEACLAEAYGGAADAAHDTRVHPTELYAYLSKELAARSHNLQTPFIEMPNDRPPRLSEAAKTAIRKLASYASQPKIDADQADQDYLHALQVSDKEPEPRLLYGLLLMKLKAREKAMSHFQELTSQMPDRLLPYAALAWLKMEKRSYLAALNDLAAMVRKIPVAHGADKTYCPEACYLFDWAGKLREHTAGLAEASPQLSDALAALDGAVHTHGPDADALYAKGRNASKRVLDDFDRKIHDADDDAVKSKLRIDRKQLGKYADFPLASYVQQLLMHLDD